MDSQPAPQQPNPTATAPAPQPALPNVPDAWPGAWGLYKYSQQVVRRNWGVLLGLVIMYVVITNLPDLFLKQSVANFVGFLLSIPLSVALIATYLKLVRGQKVSFGDSLKAGFDLKLCVNYLANSFVLALSLVILFCLLVVPFVIVLPRLVLAPFFLIDQKLGPLKAINASWDATKEHVRIIWGVIGASVAMTLLIVTVIGIPFAFYFLFMYSAAQVLLYAFILRSLPAAAASPAPVEPPETPASEAPAASS